MKGRLLASEQSAIRLTIADLLKSDEKSCFVVDRWSEFFRNRKIEYLSTALVSSFNPSNRGRPCWPVTELPAQRVAAAIILRGALQTIDAVLEIERREILARLVLVENFRAGTDTAQAELRLEGLQALIKEQSLSRGDVWRRGFVTAGIDVWEKLIVKEPKRYNLSINGVDKSTKEARPWIFDRFLNDVWATIHNKTNAIQPITFYSIKQLADKGSLELTFI